MENVISENVELGAMSISGENADAFAIQNDNCSDATLAPSETVTFDVVFSPTSLGTKTATSLIFFADQTVLPLEVLLTGLVTEICECDLNNDSFCNVFDWFLFIEDWGSTNCNEPEVDCECDLNGDGSCNVFDWFIFIEDWGRTDCPVP